MSAKQTDINAKMRAILIDWLVEVHHKFKLRPETMYLTVHLIDRYLEKEAVQRNKLQLVGITAMFVASKYEEIYAPECRDFVYISDKAYTREQILSTEGNMLAKLNFQLTAPNAYVFLKRFCKVAGVLSAQRTHADLLASYLVELTLQEYDMLKYLPSTIAASARLPRAQDARQGAVDVGPRAARRLLGGGADAVRARHQQAPQGGGRREAAGGAQEVLAGEARRRLVVHAVDLWAGAAAPPRARPGELLPASLPSPLLWTPGDPRTNVPAARTARAPPPAQRCWPRVCP